MHPHIVSKTNMSYITSTVHVCINPDLLVRCSRRATINHGIIASLKKWNKNEKEIRWLHLNTWSHTNSGGWTPAKNSSRRSDSVCWHSQIFELAGGFQGPKTPASPIWSRPTRLKSIMILSHWRESYNKYASRRKARSAPKQWSIFINKQGFDTGPIIDVNLFVICALHHGA